MKVQIRDRSRRPIGVASVDPAQRPTRVRAIAADGSDHEVYLDWERAIDDGGHLRSCIVCGCPRVYRRRTLPTFAPFALVLAGAGVVAGVLGYSSDPLVLAALVALVALDLAVLALARTQLACYRCGTVYGRVAIARYHRPWDARTAAEPECQPDADAPGAEDGAPRTPGNEPSLPSNP